MFKLSLGSDEGGFNSVIPFSIKGRERTCRAASGSSENESHHHLFCIRTFDSYGIARVYVRLLLWEVVGEELPDPLYFAV